ncbi:hypothetical protein GGI17_002719 [Coemansia sp. S146]|nr:hypothetical protein GGI17_002719 [Coemansia sp. S146]
MLQRKNTTPSYHHQQWHQKQQQQSEANDNPSVFRPILWAVSFTACAYYVSTEAFVYDLLKAKPKTTEDSKALDPRKVRPLTKIFGDPFVGLADKMIAWWKTRDTQQDAKHDTAEAAYSIDTLYKPAPVSASSAIRAFKNQCKTLTRGEYHAYAIVALNTVVFFMWGSRRLTPFMKRYFVHDPRSKRSYTLLTSVFSHCENWHYLANSVMLVTFGSEIVIRGGPEQFIFLYLSAGVLANLAAHLSMVLGKRVASVPLIGAGGATYSLVGVLASISRPVWLCAIAYMPYLIGLIPQGFPKSIGLYRPESKVMWRPALYISHVAGTLLGIGYLKWGTDQWANRVKERRDQLISART